MAPPKEANPTKQLNQLNNEWIDEAEWSEFIDGMPMKSINERQWSGINERKGGPLPKAGWMELRN